MSSINEPVEGTELSPVQPTGHRLEQFADLLVTCDDAIRFCSTPEESFAIVFGAKTAELLGFTKGYVGAVDITDDKVQLVYLIRPQVWIRDGDKEALERYVGIGRPSFTTQGKLMKELLKKKKAYITPDYKNDKHVSAELQESLNLTTVIVSPFVVFNEVVGYVLLGYPKYPSRETQWMHERLVAHAAMPIMQSYWVTKFRSEVERGVKWKILGQQAGALAHDLKTPIATLGGCLSLLESEIPASSQSSLMLQRAKNQVERLNSTIANLLSFVRELDLHIKPVKIRELIQEALDSSKPQAAETGLSGSALDKTVHVDRDKMVLVLRNIINNAYESPSDDSNTPRIVEIRANGDESEATISVLDNGRGIPADSLMRIFDPFFSTKKEGHGLGLAVASRYVTAHGGRLHPINRDIGGASVEIILPWRPPRKGKKLNGQNLNS